MKRIILASCFAALAAGTAAAEGDSQHSEGNLTLSVNIKKGCSLRFDNNSTEGQINFGTFSRINSPIASPQHWVAVECSRGFGAADENKNYITIALNGGLAFDQDKPSARWLYPNGIWDSNYPDNKIGVQIYQGLVGTKKIWGEQGDDLLKINALSVPDSGPETIQFPFWAELLPVKENNLSENQYRNIFRATVSYQPI